MDFSRHISDNNDTITLPKQCVVQDRILESKLSFLPNDFYQKLRIELAQLKGKAFDQISLLLNELLRIRHSKIVWFASVISQSNDIKKNLTYEEISYHNTMNSLTGELKQNITSVSHFCIYHDMEKRFGVKCPCGIIFCDDDDCIYHHTLECDIQKIHITTPDVDSFAR